MIRITILSHSLEETLMHIAGWITTGEDVELVAQEGRRCLAQSRQLVLDLSEAHALDEEGVALLQGWQAQGRLQILVQWPRPQGKGAGGAEQAKG